nr:hypothetical protein [Saccharolobus shibatae]
MILLSSSIESLMRLREEQLSSPFSISRDPDSVNDGSPISKWEWTSDPLDCPPNERCKPEPMVGTMSPLGIILSFEVSSISSSLCSFSTALISSTFIGIYSRK